MLCCGLSLFLTVTDAFAGKGTPPTSPKDWKIQTLAENQAFIQNKGQFDGKSNTTAPVLYGAVCGEVQLYFSTHGLCYRKETAQVRTEAERDGLEQEKDISKIQQAQQPLVAFFNGEWEGADPGTVLTAEEKRGNYYTYPGPDGTTLIANAWKKLVYHNLYPGIDVEYLFPEGKPGIKYTIIVRPGGDLSKVKLHYSGRNLQVNSSGDLLIESDLGPVTDHAPKAWDRTGKKVDVSFVLNLRPDQDPAVSFLIPGGYDHTQTLVIDPWTTNPAFATYNAAYDVEYDQNGNVYAYGGWNPFTLKKYNSSGLWQWTFTASSISGIYYGDLVTDKHSGTTYLAEGWSTAATGGAKVLKVSTGGLLQGTWAGDSSFNEIWRADYEECSRRIILAGGGTQGVHQAAMLDTAFTGIVTVNAIGTSDNGYHDMTLLAMDPAGGAAYMATTHSLVYSNFNNTLLRVPVPALAPSVWQVNDGYGIPEFTGLTYVDSNQSGYNGFNGCVCSMNYLYTYNGDTLKKWDKNTGALLAHVKTGGQALITGGIAVDACEHIYVGMVGAIGVYNSSLTQTGILPIDSTIYDLKLNALTGKLYLCGKGYVEQLDLPAGNTMSINTTSTGAGCSCTGTASASAMLCGSPASVMYSWSPGGQTTASLTGLCAGTYTVYATTGCMAAASSATVTVPASAGGILVSAGATGSPCGTSSGTATVTASGGTGTLTYSWSNGQTSTSINGLAPGTYTVTVTDSSGCYSNTSVVVTSIGGPHALASITNVTCSGAGNGIASLTIQGGTAPYTYSWSPSGGSSATASGLVPGLYTCQISDASGCVTDTIVTITQPPVLAVTGSGTVDTCMACTNATLTASPSGGTLGYTYSWNNGQTTATATGLVAGLYTCTVTDANGCTVQLVLTVSALSGIQNWTEDNGLRIYPNPARKSFTIEMLGIQHGHFRISLTNLLGQQVLEESQDVNGVFRQTVDVSGLPESLYFISIESGSRKLVSKLVIQE